MCRVGCRKLRIRELRKSGSGAVGSNTQYVSLLAKFQRLRGEPGSSRRIAGRVCCFSRTIKFKSSSFGLLSKLGKKSGIKLSGEQASVTVAFECLECILTIADIEVNKTYEPGVLRSDDPAVLRQGYLHSYLARHQVMSGRDVRKARAWGLWRLELIGVTFTQPEFATHRRE
jgi:hypothetical protein